MTRLQPQPRYPFTVDLAVRVGDLNYGGHLGFDTLAGLAHEAWIRLLSQLGVSEMDLGDGATGLITAELVVNYLGEAFLGDRLSFRIRPVQIKLASFRLAVQVVAGERHVALLEVRMAAFDYAQHRTTQLPPGLHAKLVQLSE